MSVGTKSKRRKRKIGKTTPRFFICLIALLAAAVCWFAWGANSGGSKIGTQPQQLYFINAASSTWKTETRQITIGKRTDMISEALSLLAAGPRDASLAKSVPSPSLIALVTLESGTRPDAEGQNEEYNIVRVELTGEYNELSGVDAVVCINAIVYTLTELEFVHDLHFFIGEEELLRPNGQAMGLLNRTNVLLGDIPVLPEVVDSHDVRVYFADEDAMYLVSEVHSVEVSVSKPRETYIVEALLRGPQSEHAVQTIPSEARLRSVYSEGDMCYVDFTQEFVNKFEGGSSTERLMVYSIVNSLTELSHIKKVKFLVDGDNIVDPKGFHLDLSTSFERDADLIFTEE